MDRLEKIKGYMDKCPKEDVKWLITQVEAERAAGEIAHNLMEAALREAELAATELAKLKGTLPSGTCPCNSPDSHAGWCPRR